MYDSLLNTDIPFPLIGRLQPHVVIAFELLVQLIEVGWLFISTLIGSTESRWPPMRPIPTLISLPLIHPLFPVLILQHFQQLLSHHLKCLIHILTGLGRRLNEHGAELGSDVHTFDLRDLPSWLVVFLVADQELYDGWVCLPTLLVDLNEPFMDILLRLPVSHIIIDDDRTGSLQLRVTYFDFLIILGRSCSVVDLELYGMAVYLYWLSHEISLELVGELSCRELHDQRWLSDSLVAHD